MPQLSIHIIFIAILIAILIGAITFALWKRSSRKKTNISPEQQKGLDALQAAIKKSQDIIAQAEVSQIQSVTEANITTKRYEQNVEGQIQTAQQQYLNFLKQLESQATSAQNNSQGLLTQKINTLFEQFEQNLSNFLTQTQQQSVQSIDLELKASRQLIETYKQQQLKLVDENIVAILERTLSIVLTKKLTLKDQVDLVYEALDKAKKENFIA